MKTYLLNMYYPNLADFTESVKACTEIVKELSGTNWRIIKGGDSVMTILFATDADPKTFKRKFIDPGRADFGILVVEVSGVLGGWIEKSVFQWLEDRLRRG